MRLLVSVTSAAEAAAALAGGADVIDAKDPFAGALGAVSAEVLREIHAIVAGRRPLTAALGDAADEAAIECAARDVRRRGRGAREGGLRRHRLCRVASRRLPRQRYAARQPGAAGAAVVAVAYADADRVASLAPAVLVEVAARAGAEGVLLDTADKLGPGLRELVEPRALAAWVSEAHETGLLVALAGKLTADDLTFVRDTGADIAGVRGAACDGGRTGRVTADRVRLLRALCARHSAVDCWPDRCSAKALAERRTLS